VVLAGGYAGHVKDVHIDSWKDCITAEGFDHVLCASWRDDNAGEWDVGRVTNQSTATAEETQYTHQAPINCNQAVSKNG